MAGHHPFSELRKGMSAELTSSISGTTQAKKAIQMQGQWIGRYEGDNFGDAIIDIDILNETLEGSLSIHDDDRNCADFHADFSIATKLAESGTFSLRVVAPTVYNPNQGPSVEYNSYADTDWLIDGDKIVMAWTTSEGRCGKAYCNRSNSGPASKLVPNVLTWEEAKTKFFGLERDRYIFRGQHNSKWLLQTGFHRRNRYNLSRYERLDIPLLHAETSAKTKHVFDLTKPLELGAFYALIQHHGYPTPLLDWTHSPFVAAYFAFNEKITPSDNVDYVRIFVFDEKNWCSDFYRLQTIKATYPHFSLLKPLALENPRMAPQQSVFTVTNIADIENFLLTRSEVKAKSYIYAIDIPIAHRVRALSDLSLMGISAASLFPGLDGICEYHASRNFP